MQKLVLGLVLVLSLLSLGVSAVTLNTVSNFESASLGGSTRDNWSVGGNLSVTGTSNLTGTSTVGSLQIDSGSTIQEHSCATATWNPGGLSSSTAVGNATTTDIALAGAALGDVCTASLTSATSSALRVSCNISGTATATIQLANLLDAAGAIDVATGTARVCYNGY